MSIELITVLMFFSLIVGLVIGLPLAFIMGGIGVVFSFLLWGPLSLYGISSSAGAIMSSLPLLSVPLFIFMACMLESSGLADDLYTTMYYWFGNLKGGLAVGTVIICTIFAAMSGVSAAATVTMGFIALPSMLKRGYSKKMAMGCIMAGGMLGQLIPPSTIMIVWGVENEVSVGRLFSGGIIPGLILSGIFISYILIRCYLNPLLGPPVPKEENVDWVKKLTSLKAVSIPLLTVAFVLGAIFSGAATPTESAAIGVGCTIVASAVNRRLNLQAIKKAASRTFQINGMIMWILFGAKCFTYVYTALGAPELMKKLIIAMPITPYMILIGMQVIYLIMGCFLEAIGILMITSPVFIPVIKMLGFDQVWFGVLFVINMEVAFLTPPVGFNLFYMKSVAPEGTKMSEIWVSALPWIVMQGSVLVLCIIFPQLILWLPNYIFG
jgi:tripartite ATP-independent transporter DctM subunit